MKKRIALDTNIAIDILNNKQELILHLDQFDVYYLPITVCGELLFGAINSQKSVLNTKKFQRFIKSCKILNINMAVAEEYAKIRLSLKEKGRPIPENDIWIAAICEVSNV